MISARELLDERGVLSLRVDELLGKIINGPVTHAVTNAEAASDYGTASGLSSVGAIGSVFSALAVVMVLILAIWAIVSELRAWSAGNGDSFDLGSTIIRAAILALGIVIVLAVIV